MGLGKEKGIKSMTNIDVAVALYSLEVLSTMKFNSGASCIMNMKADKVYMTINGHLLRNGSNISRKILAASGNVSAFTEPILSVRIPPGMYETMDAMDMSVNMVPISIVFIFKTSAAYRGIKVMGISVKKA